MSKRGVVAMAALFGLLVIAQVATLLLVGSRMTVRPEYLADPFFAQLTRQMALYRAGFHLLGTLLAIAWLMALRSLAPLGILPRLLFVPWGISTLAWIGWVSGGLRVPDRTEGFAGPGIMFALLACSIAIGTFAVRFVRSPADRPAALRGLALAVTVLAWSFAFLGLEFVLGVSA